MTLTPGTRLGPYEIVAPLGAGGMGEVWRARDTRLERTVAIKVLPAALSRNAQLRLRFEREAKTISQLTHPHICTLFDVGHESGVDFLVMEHIEGESLADRLAKGPLPLEQVLRVGAEIAEALERAHRAGVVHRDLKPGNVMLTKSGAKLLDFGLAKTAATPVIANDDATVQKSITQEGTIVGTFQYMAPEQLEGREADARTDLFALGAALYEMATGKRAFEAKSRASLIAAILDREPEPIANIQPLTPAAFEHLVGRCLAKDPDDRWQTAHDVRLQLEWLRDARSGVAPAVAVKRKSRDRVAWTLFAIAMLAAIAFAALYTRETMKPQPVVAASLEPPPNAKFQFQGVGPPALSPDGTKIVYIASGEGKPRLWIRSLDRNDPRPIAGTDEATFPFWSPDGKRIGFFAGGKLKKVALDGTPPAVICDAESGRGASWHGDTIIFGSRFDVIYRTTASGSTPVPLTAFDGARREGTHRWPRFLPDGRHFVFLSSPAGSESPQNTIWIAPINDGKARRPLVKSVANVAFAGDYMLYVRDGALVAQKLDADSLMLTGEALPVAPSISVNSLFSMAVFDASPTAIVLQTGSAASGVRLAETDRKGTVVSELPLPGTPISPSLSPDEKFIACAMIDHSTGKQNIWVIDRARRVSSRVTFGERDTNPAWSPDGKSIAFGVGRQDVAIVPADGSRAPRVVARVPDALEPYDWSPDGRFIVVFRRGAKAGELWLVSVADGSLRPLFRGGSNFGGRAAVSPDGQWLAYSSDETGGAELYLTRFPEPSGRWQISAGGGRFPRWSHDGTRLYYIGSDDMVSAVTVTVAAGVPQISVPETLFAADSGGPAIPYDVKRDGSFILARPLFAEPTTPLELITNWTETLRRQ